MVRRLTARLRHSVASHRGWRLKFLAPFTLICGCSPSESPLVPQSSDPFVYVILSRDPISFSPVPGADSLFAYLLTTGSPLVSPFRESARFDVTEAGSGTQFRFIRKSAAPGAIGIGPRGASGLDANFFLPPLQSGSSAGRTALRPLEKYSLFIETEGTVVTGQTIMPDTPKPFLATTANSIAVVWPRVSGAAGYYVRAVGVAEGFYTQDTLYSLNFTGNPVPIPQPSRLEIIALDINAYLYLTDRTLARAGIAGSYGVFGSATTAQLALPNSP